MDVVVIMKVIVFIRVWHVCTMMFGAEIVTMAYCVDPVVVLNPVIRLEKSDNEKKKVFFRNRLTSFVVSDLFYCNMVLCCNDFTSKSSFTPKAFLFFFPIFF